MCGAFNYACRRKVDVFALSEQRDSFSSFSKPSARISWFYWKETTAYSHMYPSVLHKHILAFSTSSQWVLCVANANGPDSQVSGMFVIARRPQKVHVAYVLSLNFIFLFSF